MSRDIITIPGEYTYATIGVAVLAMFKHVWQHYEFSFILKVTALSSIYIVVHIGAHVTESHA